MIVLDNNKLLAFYYYDFFHDLVVPSPSDDIAIAAKQQRNDDGQEDTITMTFVDRCYPLQSLASMTNKGAYCRQASMVLPERKKIFYPHEKTLLQSEEFQKKKKLF